MVDQLPIFHVVGCTGHRRLRDPAGIERVVRETLAGLKAEPGVEWLALSSVAAGTDILFARAALAQGMGWEAVLPLPPEPKLRSPGFARASAINCLTE